MLQPVFLYYTPVLYSVAGGLRLALGLSAYDALLLSLVLFSGIAFIGVWRLLRSLGCASLAAGAGSLAYLTSPYFLTDLYARAAMTEVAFFCLLPLVLHAALSQARKEEFGSFCYFVGCVALILITHKIFAGWLLILLAALHFGVVGLRPKKNLIFGLGLAAALAITSPYWLNSWLNLDHVAFAKQNPAAYIETLGRLHQVALDGEPSLVGIRWSVLTSDFSIFYPLPYTNPLSTTDHLYLQTGSMLSLALLIGLFYFRENRQLRVPLALTILGILLVCSFWNLFPFWRFMPGPLRIIQFPYRLLGFVSLAGCILAALLAEFLFRRKRYLPFGLLVLALVFQWIAFRWRPPLTEVTSAAAESMDRRDKYFWEPYAAPPPPLQAISPKFQSVTTLAANRVLFELSEPLALNEFLQLPVVFSRYLRVRADGREPLLFQDERYLVVAVRKGERSITVERRDPVGFGLAALIGALLMAGAYFASRKPPPVSLPDSAAPN